MTQMRPRSHKASSLIVELCQQFYNQGWVSGTGGGISIRDGSSIYIAPSGVQKERLSEDDMFVVNAAGDTLAKPASGHYKISACTPLFLHAYNLRNAGAVIHSHSENALLATLCFDNAFECTHLEMMKGISGTGYHDVLQVPIIENTAHECDLADSLAEAINQWPNSHAVLVRRHGVYVWGKDWVQAKTHAECYDYLFGVVVRMRQLGFDATRTPTR